MKYAFSPAGRAHLKKYIARQTLFAFDFDGTLAPLVVRPELARIPAPTLALLTKLSLLAPTAVITGRPLAVIRPLVPATFQGWAGNHGAEVLPSLAAAPNLAASRRLMRSWFKSLHKELSRFPGVFIEEKDFSLCVHFRSSPNRQAVRREILVAVTKLHPGPRILGGKCLVNLLIPGLPHKGDAVLSLLTSLAMKRVIYVGDDENDEDVFALADPRVCSIRVGKLTGSRAALYLKRQSEINPLLRLLLSLKNSTK